MENSSSFSSLRFALISAIFFAAMLCGPKVTTATEGLEAPFTPSTPPPPTPQDLNEHSFFSRTALLPPILSHLGFHELATAAQSLSDAAATASSAWSGPSTIFAPSDSSLRTCYSCSVPNLLREHIVPGIFTIEYLRRLAFGTKIETLSPGRCITITSDSVHPNTSTAAAAKVFIGGVEITQPDLFNNGMVVVHGLQGFVSTLSPFSCDVERMTSLSLMELARIPKVVLGSIAFAIFWILAVFPAVPFLPIGRTAGSLLGAMLMIIFGVLTTDQAYAAIDLQILGLLFGTMVVSVYLERADMFKYIGKLLSWKRRGAKDLLCRICLISAVSSALFTNDTSCVVLTEFVLKIARKHGLPPHPFLLALATSANIGSSATPIGNPQNLVIAIQSKISFGKFLTGILPAMLVGVVVNALMLITMYWRLLSVHMDEENPVAVVAGEDFNCYMLCCTSFNCQEKNASLEYTELRNSPRVETPRNQSAPSDSEIKRVLSSTTDSPRNSTASEEGTNGMHIADGKDIRSIKWKRMWKFCVYTITLGMLVGMLLGLNMSWTAIVAALALVVLDFKDAGPCLEKVSYSLLVFFCGMFITVDGFNKTGIPGAIWDIMEPYSHVDRVSGVAVLALVILVLSNLASNVPTVLLLGARVAASAAAISKEDEKWAWFILAWVSTIAGNMSLLGSAANLIVCEQARQAPDLPYTLTFWTHLKFGLPSTLIVTAIGLILLR